MITLPPAYGGIGGDGSATTFLALLDTFNDYTDLGGMPLRVNGSGTGVEAYSQSSSIPNVVFVSSEDDLPPLNASNEHPLASDTTYQITGNISIANPLRITGTTTEISGNGIGASKITYTGTGFGILANSGSESVRLKFVQFISTAGDGIDHIGSGSGTGTNISLDRAYVIATSGIGVRSSSCDFFFTSAAVIIASTPVLTPLGSSGIMAMELTLMQSTTIGNILDLGSCVFEDITCSSLIFKGTTGSTAIAGLPSSGNITNTGGFNGCIVSSELIPFSGMSSFDVGYSYSGNTGIPDSKAIGFGYLSASEITTVIDGIPAPINGVWVQHSETERATVSTSGIIEMDNSESIKGPVSLILSASKVSGGDKDYIFKIQKQSLGVGGFTDIEAASKSVTLSTNVSSVTIVGITSFVSTDQYRAVVVGDGTSNPINIEVTNFIVGN